MSTITIYNVSNISRMLFLLTPYLKASTMDSEYSVNHEIKNSRKEPPKKVHIKFDS